MTREQLIQNITGMVGKYIADISPDAYPDLHLRIDPDTLRAILVDGRDMLAELEYNNEAVEDAAGAQGAMNEDATDAQVTRNPDFYPVAGLVARKPGEPAVPDAKAIAAVADRYFSSAG